MGIRGSENIIFIKKVKKKKIKQMVVIDSYGIGLQVVLMVKCIISARKTTEKVA